MNSVTDVLFIESSDLIGTGARPLGKGWGRR